MERWRLTIHFECLARLGLDPFAVDVTDILLEKRGIFKLDGVSIVVNPIFNE
jgi:hypothetical protein